MKYRNVSDRALYSPASRPQVAQPDEVVEFPPDANPSPDLWAPLPVTTKKAAKAEED